MNQGLVLLLAWCEFLVLLTALTWLLLRTK
jgi:hypothetical protein